MKTYQILNEVMINVTDFFSTLPQAQRGAAADMSANACVSSVQTIYGQLVSQVDNWKVAKHLKQYLGTQNSGSRI